MPQPLIDPQSIGLGRLFWAIEDAVIVAEAGTGRIVLWNPGAEAIFGYTAAEALALPLAHLVPPALRQAHREGIAHYGATGQGALIDAHRPVEVPALRKTGEEITVDLRLSRIETEAGSGRLVMAIVRDVTARKEAQLQQLRAAEERIAREEADAARRQVTDVLDRVTDMFVAVDSHWRVTYINRSATGFLTQTGGREVAAMLGEALWERYPQAVGTRFYREFERALREGVTVAFEDRYPGSDYWFAVQAYPSADGLSIFFRDVSEEKRAAERQRLLVEASTLLASSLDYATTLRSVAQLLVPAFADWCIVDVLDWHRDGRHGEIQRVVTAAADPHKQELLLTLKERYAPTWESPQPAAQALRSGETVLMSLFTPESLERTVRDAEHLALMVALAPHSALAVPLVARGHTLGVLTLSWAESERQYSQADVGVIEELARRCAVALDNAMLYRAAREAVQARDDFLSVASHELKTPVTSLRGFAQLAQRTLERGQGIDPQRVVQVLGALDRQSQKLVRLIEQLLDVSRVDANKLSLDREWTDVVPLVRATAQATQTQAENHTISVVAPDHLGAFVDALRLEQVLVNLLDNAVKYSPAGGPIEVTVSMVEGEILRIAVRDRGIGVTPQHRDHLFDRFYQVQGGHRVGGLGLGLYISRQIVVLHGGDLTAEFPPDGGSCFVVALPRAGAKGPAGSP